MRPALRRIETIERYLLGEMNTNELDAFELTMNYNEDFKNEVELQKQLIHSLERISLQNSIQNAAKTYKLWKLLKSIGMVVIPIAIALSVWYFTKDSMEAETIPTKVEQIIEQEIVSIPDTIIKKTVTKATEQHTSLFTENINPFLDNIPSEIFTIASEKETIVETQNGIVLLIPPAAFVDANTNVVTGNVQLKIKEAIDPYTIMTAGLSTLFDDKPLETGGMFFIEATKDGKKLQIHPQKEITADIPTQNSYERWQYELDKSETTEQSTNSTRYLQPKFLSAKLFGYTF